MGRLRDLWRALTAPPEDAVSSCSYGVPLRLDPDAVEIAEAAMRAAQPETYRPLYTKKLGSDADVIREVRVIKNETDINPVSGIPYSDSARKEWQLDTFMFEYFPDAWLAVVQVAIAGNRQHNPGQPLHWAREKSKDQFNTAFRHYWERRRGVFKDTDGQYHLAKAIWRQMAQLQLDIEADRKKEST